MGLSEPEEDGEKRMKGDTTFRKYRDEAIETARRFYRTDWVMYSHYVGRAKRYHHFLMQSIYDGQ